MCSDSIVTQQRVVWYVHDVVWYCAHLTEEVKEFHLGKRTNLFIEIHTKLIQISCIYTCSCCIIIAYYYYMYMQWL